MNGIDKLAATPALLTYSETSQLLGVKVGTLYSWVSRRVIPFVRLSPRVVRFRRDEVATWLSERSFSPVSSTSNS